MTIKPGRPWGERRVPPSALDRADSDSEAAALISLGLREFLLTGGDMWRTIGGSAPHDGSCTVVSVDLLTVELGVGDTVEQTWALAHAVFDRSGGTFGRGDVSYVMNAQYLGLWDLAPRSHPNDGRMDVVTISADMSWRQRRLLRRRLPTGTHLPHPQIRTQSLVGPWVADETGTLTLDGKRRLSVDRVRIGLEADALTIWI